MADNNFSLTPKRDLPQKDLIVVKNLCKSFTDSSAQINVLQNLSFDLDKGETIAVVGPSGIGKSTFLHIIGTLDRPDSGNFLFRGEDVFSFDNARLAKFRNESIGFVFQFHHLLPEFNALENTMMPALIGGTSKKKAKDSAEAILVRMGLENRLSHRVGALSGGEQQRVALARALVIKPDVILADEPTGNLDRKNGRLIHELLMELNREFCMTLVVVTHNMELAALMSRRVTIVNGQLVETE